MKPSRNVPAADSAASERSASLPQALVPSVDLFPVVDAAPDGVARARKDLDSLMSFAGLDAPAVGKLSSLTLGLLEGAMTKSSVALNDVRGASETLGLDSLIAVDIKLSSRLGENGLLPFVAMGLVNPAVIGNVVSGQVRLGDLGKLVALEHVGTVSYSPHATAAGSVVSGAESALGTLALNTSGYTGAGVKVGVLSDSYNYLQGASAGIASGDLPSSGVQVLQDTGSIGSPTSDEGRAMLEIVHDIAPDSSLMFATAWQGMAGFAQNIRGLAAAGARVIVDDIAYFSQLTFTDDVIRRAINDVTGQGSVYLTANGNDSRHGIIESDSVYRLAAPAALGSGNFLDFNPATTGVVETLSFTAEQTGTVYLRMTWSSPAWSVHSKLASADLDVYVVDSEGNIVGDSVDDQSLAGFDPIELVAMDVVAGQQYAVWVDKYSGTAPKYVQINAPVGAISFNQPSLFDEYSAVYGNALAAGAISVGAAYYKDSPKLGGSAEVEAYSSYGKAYLTHDAAGNAITPQTSIGAEITGVDGLNTTFFGSDWDADGHPNFFGTSAAAPSVAAVVALMLDKNPTLTRDQILSILQSTAYDAVSYADEAPFDPVSGAGLVNAAAALAATPELDLTAPTVAQFTPVDGATAVPTYSNIVLKFDEAIQRGTGTIKIVTTTPTGTLRESFDAATSTRLKIDGDTLTIDPTSNLSGLTRYYVTFSAGSVKDVAGNSYAGTTAYDFVTASADTTAPLVSQFSPADGATGVSPAANVSLTFSEAIQRGTGTIYLRSGSSTGTIVESFNAATSDRLSIVDKTLTLDPTANLVSNTRYFVTFGFGTVKDLAGNNYGGTSTYDFLTATVDLTAPTVTQFSPVDGATGVSPTTNLSLTFSEAIRKGAGTIELRTGSATGEVVESFNVADSSQVTVSGNVLTVDPTATLADGTKYWLTLGPGVIEDLAGNDYAGTTTYDLTTATPPPASQFNIDINFSGLTQYKTYFDQAALLFETMVTGDLPDVNLNGQLVDDLKIDASVVTIDGVGGILGQAGFTYYRTGSLMPIAGIMQFDAADVASMVSSGIFADVVAHEMAHVLGFGTLWSPGFRGLNSTFGQYTGQQALNEYRLLSGNSSASYVPLETVGGSGTVNAHWAESVFGAELMTGYASSSGNMPLSRMTVASFADIGYQINYGVAEEYSLPGAVSAIRAIASGSGVEMTEIAAGDIYGVVGGSVGNDRLMGTASNDYFSNLEGRDVIVTGSGSDQIFFSRMATAGDIDVITDFVPSTDTLVFDVGVFVALAPFAGADSVGSGNFLLGGRALDADDFLLYDATTQILYYDADGSGAQLANPVATILPGDQLLSYVNFVVV